MTSELDTEDPGLSVGTCRVNVFGLACEMCGQRFNLGTYGHMLVLGPPDGEHRGLGLLLNRQVLSPRTTERTV